MKWTAMWRRALSLAGAMFLLGSCDRAPVAPLVPAVPVGTPPATDAVPVSTGDSATTGDSVTGSWWLGGLLLRCSPLPYDSTSTVIGPDGGSLNVGPHTFTVPAGALDTATLITAVVDPTTVNQVRFSPQGLVFQRPASLTMSYANCGLFGLLIPKRIAYVTDGFRILQIIPSIDDALNRRVTGQVSHFSQYAIAW